MIPVLYDKEKIVFGNDYIGVLADTISCEVTEERNGEYELEMEYPVTGAHYDSLALDAIIKAKPNMQDNPQPFRIYRISTAINGIITVSARHIVYDLSKVTVEPFATTGGIQDAIAGIMNHSIPSCGFIFETDKTTTGNYKVSVPSSFRSLMGGSSGSLLDVYGTAEYHYDEYNIDLLQDRGEDSGAVIKYGVNLIDLKQEEACDSVYTAVYPFWQYGNDFVSLDERIVSVEGSYPFSRIMALDLSRDFNDMPTQTQLRNKARQYIADNNIGVPKVSLSVNFTTENININLCDIVSVEFEKLGITASAKCIALTYDVINERVLNIKLGYYRHDFVDVVTDQMKGITQYATIEESEIEKAIRNVTDNGRGYVLLHSSTNTGKMDEILLLSGSDNINTAQKIWRWNKNGLGYSSTGYNGTYTSAITMQGEIVASMVKTGVLKAIELKTINNTFHVTKLGYLTSTAGYIGPQSGTGFTITATDISSNRIKLYEYGIGIKDDNGRLLGFVGKTDRQQYGPDYYPHNPWATALPTVVNPGFGVFASAYATGCGMYYNKDGSNYRIFFFPTSYTLPIYNSPENNPVIDDCLQIYKDIHMHGNGFYVPFRTYVEPGYGNYDPYEPSGGSYSDWHLDGDRVSKSNWSGIPALYTSSQTVYFNKFRLANGKGEGGNTRYIIGILKMTT